MKKVHEGGYRGLRGWPQMGIHHRYHRLTRMDNSRISQTTTITPIHPAVCLKATLDACGDGLATNCTDLHDWIINGLPTNYPIGKRTHQGTKD